MRRLRGYLFGAAGFLITAPGLAEEGVAQPISAEPNVEPPWLPPPEKSAAEYWTEREAGPGFYGMVWAAPQWARGGLESVFQPRAQGGGGLEAGFQYDQWQVGLHFGGWSTTLVKDEDTDPTRFAIGLAVGRRITLAHPFSLRIGAGYNFNLIGDCVLEGEGEETVCVSEEAEDYQGHGLDGDILLSMTVFGIYPAHGVRTHVDVFSGLRMTGLWLDHPTVGPFQGYAVAWLSGLSVHTNVYGD